MRVRRLGGRAASGCIVAAAVALLAGCGGGSMSGMGYATSTASQPAMPPTMMTDPMMPNPMTPAPTMPTSMPGYGMTVLVSDGAMSAATVDKHLVNPWGIAFAANAPVWIANNGSQSSTLYDGSGVQQSLIVTLPAGLNGAADPTGIVSNDAMEFMVTQGAASAPAQFIFDGENGTIMAWSSTVDAQNASIMYDDGAGHADYKGLAVAQDADGNEHLYATDFQNAKVDVFDGSFKKVSTTGGFVDASLPADYAPFGIQTLSVSNQVLIYVTYAKHQPGNRDSVAGAGLGLVDVFDAQGTLKLRLIAVGGRLNAPWGMALAPTSFGSLSNALLVGNVGDGVINAFDPNTGDFMGSVNDANGQPIANAGLWGIAFGNGAYNQPATTLFFTAGIANGADGVYGRIDAVSSAPMTPMPSPMPYMP
jgi:uncharacterized protein (TIGR03118 family)